jgi:hypothetical protein
MGADVNDRQLKSEFAAVSVRLELDPGCPYSLVGQVLR